MLQNIFKILKGYFEWFKLRIRYRINYQKVVLVLPEEDDELNYFALAHLENWLKRKSAKKAIILTNQNNVLEMAKALAYSFPVQICICNDEEIEHLYNYYCFDKFFDNIVFIYKSRPLDNLLYRIIKETSINKEEAVCLGFYCLRRVPVINEQYRKDKICTLMN